MRTRGVTRRLFLATSPDDALEPQRSAEYAEGRRGRRHSIVITSESEGSALVVRPVERRDESRSLAPLVMTGALQSSASLCVLWGKKQLTFFRCSPSCRSKSGLPTRPHLLH